jgi:hypothetical protein
VLRKELDRVNEQLRQQSPASPADSPVDPDEFSGAGGAVGRLRRLSKQSSVSPSPLGTPTDDGGLPPRRTTGPPPLSPAKTVAQLQQLELNAATAEGERAAAEAALKAAKKKEAKKLVKLEALQADASKAWSANLPRDDDALAPSTSSTMAAASREALHHQVIKQRATFERLYKERDALAAELEAVSRSTADDDDGDGDDDAAYLRHVMKAIADDERDWRLKYLVEQLEARRGTIRELELQTAGIRDLEDRMSAVNAQIQGYTKQQSDVRRVASSPGMRNNASGF